MVNSKQDSSNDISDSDIYFDGIDEDNNFDVNSLDDVVDDTVFIDEDSKIMNEPQTDIYDTMLKIYSIENDNSDGINFDQTTANYGSGAIWTT